MKKLLLLVAIAASLCGCPDDYNVRPPGRGEIGSVVDKNYTIGQAQIANVGQPIVRVKSYGVNRVPAFTSPVGITGSMREMQAVELPPNAQFQVVSLMDYEGSAYSVVQPSPALPSNPRLLVDEGGHYKGLAVSLDSDVFEPCEDEDEVCVLPKAIDFKPSKIESVLGSSSFINFEIIYSGATKDTINLLYREYTPDNMARAAFTQNLTYDRVSSSVRFRDVQIRVLDANNESMRYVVESDGSGDDLN